MATLIGSIGGKFALFVFAQANVDMGERKISENGFVRFRSAYWGSKGLTGTIHTEKRQQILS